MPATFDAARRIALSLDRVEEGMSYGTPGFRVAGALFLRFHQDGESLVVRTDFEQRAELLAGDPATYYITEHYRNYPWVLVRLSHVRADALRDIIRMAHKTAAAEKRHAPKRGATKRRRA
ncbi:MAG: MmcQ/YjbR family DNA-binding protein [Candidatus Acidiferrales bacterium]